MQVINKDGDKININVSFWLNNNKPNYDISVCICKKGKRKFYDPLHELTNDYCFRKLSMPERREFIFNKILEIVPIEFINKAKRETHELLKPL